MNKKKLDPEIYKCFSSLSFAFIFLLKKNLRGGIIPPGGGGIIIGTKKKKKWKKRVRCNDSTRVFRIKIKKITITISIKYTFFHVYASIMYLRGGIPPGGGGIIIGFAIVGAVRKGE